MTEAHRVLEALRGVSPERTARGIGRDVARAFAKVDRSTHSA
jgi:hypothetical protein